MNNIKKCLIGAALISCFTANVYANSLTTIYTNLTNKCACSYSTANSLSCKPTQSAGTKVYVFILSSYPYKLVGSMTQGETIYIPNEASIVYGVSKQEADGEVTAVLRPNIVNNNVTVVTVKRAGQPDGVAPFPVDPTTCNLQP